MILVPVPDLLLSELLIPILYFTSLAATVAGGVYSSISQMQAAEAARDIAKASAAHIRSETALQVEAQRRRARILLGKQRGAFAAAGVQLTSGPLDLLASESAEQELIAQQIRRAGEFEAASVLSRAKLQSEQLKAGAIGSMLGTSSTILSSTAMFQMGGGFDMFSSKNAVDIAAQTQASIDRQVNAMSTPVAITRF